MASRPDESHDADPLKAYLRDISGLTPLSREEETRLARQGDEEALRTLVECNLKYVVMVAHRYKGLGMSLADLINEGNIGLMEAAKRFDPERGFKFITYAVWWIRQSILRALAEQARVVRLPVKQAGLLSRITRTIARLTQEQRREPSMAEVAEALHLRPKALETVMWVYRDYMSLDTPLSAEDSSLRFIDLLESDPEHNVEEEFVRFCLHHDLERLMADLPPREREVLRLRYGFDDLPMTLEQIGERLHLTRERIRQIEKAARDKLRTRTNMKILEDYLR